MEWNRGNSPSSKHPLKRGPFDRNLLGCEDGATLGQYRLTRGDYCEERALGGDGFRLFTSCCVCNGGLGGETGNKRRLPYQAMLEFG
jgi:hypothetical protein